MIQPLWVFSAWAVLIARVILGMVLVRHGVPKLKDLKGTGEWMQSVGYRPGKLFAFLAGALEVVGGFALIAGFLVQPVALLVAIQFVIILLTVKRKAKMGDKELDLAILALAILFAAIGAEKFSLDAYFGWILY